MRPSPSLRVQIAVAIALLAIAMAWSFTVITGSKIVHKAQQISGELLAKNAYMMMARLDRDMDYRIALLGTLGSLPFIRHRNDPQAIRATLSNTSESLPALVWMALTDAKGYVLVATDPRLESTSLAEHPLYRQAVDKLYLGDRLEGTLITEEPGQQARLVDLSQPLFADDGSFSGVLAARFSWQLASNALAQLPVLDADTQDLQLLILGHDRQVLLGPAHLQGRPLPALARQSSLAWQALDWPEEGRFLTAFAKSRHPSLGWQLLLRQPLAAANQVDTEITLSIFWSSFVVSLAVAALGWWLSGRITRPLTRIARAADRLSAGIPTVIPQVRGAREIETLSQSISQLVQNLSQQQSALGAMESLALKDPLTGLPNRSALLRFMQGQVDPLVFLYLDLDDFKGINDRLGHQTGDKVLREVASRLVHNIREGDIAVRLGGDEFLVALQLGPHIQPVQVAERILATLNQPISLGQEMLDVGCSMGGAYWPKDHEDPKAAVDLADRALYQAKAAGKGRVHFYRHPD